MMFSDFTDDGPMWTGTGPREVSSVVRFDTPFTNTPSVHVALNMWDCNSDTNQRMDLSAEDITEGGFSLVFRTWGDSRVARVRASWMVIGSVPYDDNWELY